MNKTPLSTISPLVGISQDPNIIDYSNPDAISALILDALIQSGLGKHDLTNPFRDIIRQGSSVLIKPNWVHHENISGSGMDCMITHPQFILSTLELIVRASPRKIIIADAPIQGCIWEKLINKDFLNTIKKISQNITTEILDLRLQKIVDIRRIEALQEQTDYIIFDLGDQSLLEPISRDSSKFRVTMYDPSVMKSTHSIGKHQYFISRIPFESDVIINLPKLKTHKKAGLTGALKNLVGLNGNKGFLPHHRVGSPGFNGDCYPKFSFLKRGAEIYLDKANKDFNNTGKYHYFIDRAYKLLKIRKTFGLDTEIEGNWYGNDTIWRTVLDINRIIRYGRLNGTMANNQQRLVWNLTDSIISGQGEGPLSPTPYHTGVVTSSPSASMADAVHATLLGFDYNKIPLIKNSFNDVKWSITENQGIVTQYMGKINKGEKFFPNITGRAKPPKGWSGKIELE